MHVKPGGALFFTRFNFTLSYRPGSKNQKPDALSRQCDSSLTDRSPEAILPSVHIVASLQWDIETVVQEAQT